MDSDREGVRGIQVQSRTKRKAMHIDTHKGTFMGRSVANIMRARIDASIFRMSSGWRISYMTSRLTRPVRRKPRKVKQLSRNSLNGKSTTA